MTEMIIEQMTEDELIQVLNHYWDWSEDQEEEK